MKICAIAVFALAIIMGAPAFAEETRSSPETKNQDPIPENNEGPKKPKSLDVPLDVATDVIRKTNAFFQGNLEITMPPDTGKYKNKDNYTTNVIGRKVPRSTVTR